MRHCFWNTATHSLRKFTNHICWETSRDTQNERNGSCWICAGSISIFYIWRDFYDTYSPFTCFFACWHVSHKKRCYAWQRVCRRRFIDYFDSIFLGIPVWICNSCPLIRTDWMSKRTFYRINEIGAWPRSMHVMPRFTLVFFQNRLRCLQHSRQAIFSPNR